MITEEIGNIKSGKSELRKFGITVGIVTSLVGGVLLWQEKDYHYYFFMLSAVFLLFGLAASTLLKPLQKAWMTLAVLIGWVMTRIILTVLFYMGVTVLGLLMRLFKKKLLDTGFDTGADTYWIAREPVEFKKEDYEKQF